MLLENLEWLEAARPLAQMTSHDFEELYAQSDPETGKALLRARFRVNRDEFLRYCFPEIFTSPWNRFHLEMLAGEKPHWSGVHRDGRRLLLAPRGIGKTTTKKGDTAHSIVYGLRRFLILVGATRPDAKGWAATLANWFRERTDDNAALWDLYGPFSVEGEKQRFTIHTPRGPCTVLCASTNTSLQGANELTHRPDELLLDDWEDRKRVRSQTTRAGWERKLREEMLKLGARDRGMLTDACVTLNHPEQPSAKIRRADDGFRGWDVLEFPAIEAWPERLDLWHQCGRLFTSLHLGDVERREQLARTFYESNREEMDARGRAARPSPPAPLQVLRLDLVRWHVGLPSRVPAQDPGAWRAPLRQHEVRALPSGQRVHWWRAPVGDLQRRWATGPSQGLPRQSQPVGPCSRNAGWRRCCHRGATARSTRLHLRG